jgi:hypothetical protein
MKTQSVLFISALTLIGITTTSCNKDDDKYELPAATLTGKWFYSKVVGAVGGVEFLDNYDGNEDGCSKDYVEFGSNGTFADVDYDSTDSPCEVFADAGTYAVAGNTIIVDFGDQATTATILNLSYTELKVKDSDSGEIAVFTRQ